MNLAALEATKRSILDDPDFNMGTWDHCVAGHICKSAGYDVVTHPSPIFIGLHTTYVAANGQRLSVTETAYSIVGCPPGMLNHLFYYGFFNNRDKQMAIDKINRFIDDHAFLADRIEEPVEEEEDEPVLV